MATEYHNGDLKRILERVAKDGDASTRAAMAAAGKSLESTTQGLTHVVTGQLRSSIAATEPTQDANGWTVGLKATVPYARFHPRLFRKAGKAAKASVVPLMKPLYHSWR